MSPLLLVFLGLAIAATLLVLAGMSDEGKMAAGIGLAGAIILLICCSLLYCWGNGKASISWWGLDKKATYLLISQTEVDAGSKTYVVVLQNAIDKSFWCIMVENKLPNDQSIFKIVKSEDKLTLQPVTPFSAGKPASPVEAPKTEKPSPPAAPADKTKDQKQEPK